jgi:hypothetical protein
MDCSICLGSLPGRATRSTKSLTCGHTFHKSCIDGWEAAGLRFTCPMCRSPQGPPKYKLTITIENLQTNIVESVPTTQEEAEPIIRTILDISGHEDHVSTSLIFDEISQTNIEDVLHDFGLVWQL